MNAKDDMEDVVHLIKGLCKRYDKEAEPDVWADEMLHSLRRALKCNRTWMVQLHLYYWRLFAHNTYNKDPVGLYLKETARVKHFFS